MLFDVATEADDAELRRILRENPMEGEIRIALRREPSVFLAATIEGDVHQIVVARDEIGGRLLGMGSRSVRSAWVNGRPARLGYLSQLRVDRGHRARPRMVAGGYAAIRAWRREGETLFDVTTIVEDNLRARRFLEAGIEGLPTYEPRERFLTIVIPVPRRRRRRASGIAIRRGCPDTLDAIVECLERNAPRFQFAPRWSREDLLSSERTRGLRIEDFRVAIEAGRVIGCLARWDQRSFKQAVVHGYSRRLALLRPLVNVAAPVIGVSRLPEAGEEIRCAFLSHAAVDGDDPDVLLALVAAWRDESAVEPLDHLILGLAERNPLAGAVRNAFPHREYASIIYVVYWKDGAAAAADLDGRVPHLEASTL